MGLAQVIDCFSHFMDTLDVNPASIPFVLQTSFSIRLDAAKKAAVEAALKYRQERLRAAGLKLRRVSYTEVPKSCSSVNGQPTDVNNDPQPSVNVETEPTQNPVIPFKFTTHYSELKSARKRKRPSDSEITDSLLSPSASKPSTDSPAAANLPSKTMAHPVST